MHGPPNSFLTQKTLDNKYKHHMNGHVEISKQDYLSNTTVDRRVEVFGV